MTFDNKTGRIFMDSIEEVVILFERYINISNTECVDTTTGEIIQRMDTISKVNPDVIENIIKKKKAKAVKAKVVKVKKTNTQITLF